MKLAVLFVICTLSNAVFGQGYFILKDNTAQTFAFELINNSVIVPVTINGIKLSFLLDTGVKETMLFGNNQDSLSLDNVHKVRFSGLGIEDGIDGLLALSNTVEVGNSLLDTNHNLYIILSDELDISSHLGTEINGIMGSRFFQDYLIEMDYVKKKITIHPKAFQLPTKIENKYTVLPISIERERPYITTPVLLHNGWVEAKLLVDMGNTEALMLFPLAIPHFHLNKPSVEDYIGKGFNGEIFGQRNRIKAFKMGSYTLQYPIVSYPDSSAVQLTKVAPDRKGSIGNQTLLRFHLFIDYPNNRILLKKNKLFGKPFYFNISGIDVKHDGMVWSKKMIDVITQREKRDPQQAGTMITFDSERFSYQFTLTPNYVVSGIRKNSPAQHAGVKVGDALIKINGKNVTEMTLLAINTKLQKPNNHDLKLLVSREGKDIILSFKLVDPIPFVE